MELENEKTNNSSEELPLKRGIEQLVQAVQGSKDGAKQVDGGGAAPDGAAAGNSPEAGTSSVGEGEGFEITVAFKKDKFAVKVTDAMTISELKSHLEPLSGVPAGNQKLMYKSMLDDNKTVGACALKAGIKVMLIGTSMEVLAKEQLSKIVAAVEPLAGKGAANIPTLADDTQHKKIIEKGVPEGAIPGILGRKDSLAEQNNVLRNVYDKRGEVVRLTFKLEDNQMWIGAKTRTDKLNLSQIQGVTWEPIASAPGYNILTIKAGATEKSNLYYYFVPNQYCDSIRRLVMD